MIVLAMTSLVAILGIAAPEYLCGSSQCPPEKPFCTSAGCVYQCPEPSFVNGTRCVIACNDGVVDGNTCLDNCPEDKNVTFEKVVVINYMFMKFRVCLKSCDVSGSILFEYNQTCVHNCPRNASYVIGKICSNGCSGTHPFMYKASDNQSHVECVRRCPLDKPFNRNYTCVADCNPREVLVEKSCSERCPNSSYFIYQNTCITACPYNTYKTNTSCTNQCVSQNSSVSIFIYGTSCLDQCPEESSFFKQTDRGYVCVAKCNGFMYTLERQCVDLCPNSTYVVNKSCVQSCPSNLPYKLIRQKQFYAIPGHREFVKCVRECPTYMFYNNVSCTEECPVKVLNRTCVNECPNLYSTKQCYDECPKQLYRYKNECVIKCPKEANSMFNHTCLAECPTGMYTFQDKCVNECPASTFYNGTKCTVLHCPTDYVIFNRTCVTRCPMLTLKVGDSCIYKCPTNTFYYNNKCVSKCPNDRFKYNQTCFDKCPQAAPFKYDSCIILGTDCGNEYKKCVDKCPDSFSLNSTCVEFCPSNLIQYDSQCVDVCPGGWFWWGTRGSVGTCASVGTIYLYIFGSATYIFLFVMCCVKILRKRPCHGFITLLRSVGKTIVNARKRPEDYQLIPRDVGGEEEEV